MKKHYYTIGLFFSGILLLSSFSNNPPNARTGAPGEGLCTDCHAPGNSSADGVITIENFPDEIIPNQKYNLTVRITNPNGMAQKAGFQMTIQDAGGAGSGVMDNASANSVVTDAGGKQYFEHNPAVAIDSVALWTVDWTAPDAASGTPIFFYAAGNLVNGNGQNSGDLVVTDTGDGMIETISSSKNVRLDQIEIFPNPVSEVLNVYMANQSLIEQVNILTLSGQRMISVNAGNNQVDVSQLNSGIYLVQVKTNTGLFVTKMIKQ